MRLTIQLCTYNRARLLERVLEALFDQTVPGDAYEVVLVNDGSPDDTASVIERVRPLARCAFTAITQPNAGLAKGRNAGIARATGERICFIDDDVLPTPVFAAEHLASDAEHGDVIVRGAVLNTETFDDLPAPVWTLANYSGNYFWTSNVSLRRSRLDAIGGRFDESFTEYGWEDIELGMRLRALGTRAVFNRYALAFHHKPRPAGANVAGMLRQVRAQARTAVQLRSKHPHWRVDLAIGTTAPQRALGGLVHRSGVARLLAPFAGPPEQTRRLSAPQRLAAQLLATDAYYDELATAEAAHAAAPLSGPAHIVLSRLDRVGDLILSTPAIATVRRAFPAAHITIVCSEYNAVVVEKSPDVDVVTCLPAEIRPQAFGARFRDADLAIALAPNAADMRLIAATRAPRRIGYTYERRYLTRLVAQRWLTDCLISNADPERCESVPHRVVMHEVNQVLALAQRAGATEIVPDLRIAIDAADRAAVADFPPDPIIVHLGRRWTERGSTTESLLQLFAELRPLGRPLVATYGADAVELADAVRGANLADRVAGGMTFGQWAAAFERAACIVTIDTGATHVASAVKRPTVVLFEHTYFWLNSQEWSPYRVPNAVLRKPPTDAPDALTASRAEIVAAVARLL